MPQLTPSSEGPFRTPRTLLQPNQRIYRDDSLAFSLSQLAWLPERGGSTLVPIGNQVLERAESLRKEALLLSPLIARSDIATFHDEVLGAVRDVQRLREDIDAEARANSGAALSDATRTRAIALRNHLARLARVADDFESDLARIARFDRSAVDRIPPWRNRIKDGDYAGIRRADDGTFMIRSDATFEQLLGALALQLCTALQIIDTWTRDEIGNYSPRDDTAGDLSGSFRAAWQDVELLALACIGLPLFQSLPPARPDEAVRTGKYNPPHSIELFSSRLRQLTFAMAKWKPGDIITAEQLRRLRAVYESLPSVSGSSGQASQPARGGSGSTSPMVGSRPTMPTVQSPQADAAVSVAGYVPADTLEHRHGIRPQRLSEAVAGGKVDRIRAPRGMIDSRGRAVRKLYNEAKAIKHCVPKNLRK